MKFATIKATIVPRQTVHSPCNGGFSPQITKSVGGFPPTRQNISNRVASGAAGEHCTLGRIITDGLILDCRVFQRSAARILISNWINWLKIQRAPGRCTRMNLNSDIGRPHKNPRKCIEQQNLFQRGVQNNPAALNALASILNCRSYHVPNGR